MDIQDYVSDLARQHGFVPDPHAVACTAQQMHLEWLHRRQYAAMMGMPGPEPDFQDSQALEDHFRRAAAEELLLQWAIQDVIDRSIVSVTPQELQQEASAMAKRQHMRMEDVTALFGEDLHLLKQDLLERKAMTWMETQLANPIFKP